MERWEDILERPETVQWDELTTEVKSKQKMAHYRPHS
jgi:hypothetical protein